MSVLLQCGASDTVDASKSPADIHPFFLSGAKDILTPA
jgi:hypothetical protein